MCPGLLVFSFIGGWWYLYHSMILWDTRLLCKLSLWADRRESRGGTESKGNQPAGSHIKKISIPLSKAAFSSASVQTKKNLKVKTGSLICDIFWNTVKGFLQDEGSNPQTGLFKLGHVKRGWPARRTQWEAWLLFSLSACPSFARAWICRPCQTGSCTRTHDTYGLPLNCACCF